MTFSPFLLGVGLCVFSQFSHDSFHAPFARFFSFPALSPPPPPRFEAASVLDGRKGEAVTAVAFAPIPTPSSSTKDLEAVLAVGTEGGRIGMWSIRLPSSAGGMAAQDASSRLLLAAPALNCHAGAVKKLAWRPLGATRTSAKEEEGNGSKVSRLELASCGMDHGVRIFELLLESR